MQYIDKNIFLRIADNLDDEELAYFCRTNKQIRTFCQSDNFSLWVNRLNKYLGKYYTKIDLNRTTFDIMNEYRQKLNMSWRDYYISTIHILDQYFMQAIMPEDIKEFEREDIQDLLRIMRQEPFNVFTIDRLYENIKKDENILKNLDKTDNRWTDPNTLIADIVTGRIKDEILIDHILHDKRLNYDDYGSTLGNATIGSPTNWKNYEKIIKMMVENGDAVKYFSNPRFRAYKPETIPLWKYYRNKKDLNEEERKFFERLEEQMTKNAEGYRDMEKLFE